MVGPFHCLEYLLFGRPEGNTLVQAHDYVGAQSPLDVHRNLRAQSVGDAVDV